MNSEECVLVVILDPDVKSHLTAHIELLVLFCHILMVEMQRGEY